jgi:hypothetical protein
MCCEGAGRAGAEALCQVRGSKELAPPDDRSRVLLPLEVHDLCHLRPHSATRVLVVSVDCCGTGVSRAGICLPRGPHAAPACPVAPSRRLHAGVLPPLPAHLGSSSVPVGC